MFPKRNGLIIWFQDMKNTRVLEKYGMVHYVSKKMDYAVLYVFEDKMEEIQHKLMKLPFVTGVEPSYRKHLKTTYDGNIADKTKFFVF
ncbi:YlbG family protein [Longirhabdus pacifica]|uniref:YlbG family protein n=1 Tax=Longirhabdus pacifica TaxID=2305227 RepID=UPI0010087A31|nr:YlbG family protein [Longirhabdus pacifica]